MNNAANITSNANTLNNAGAEGEEKVRYSYAANQPQKEEKTEFNGIQLTVYPPVYLPREDSFALARAVDKFAFGKVLDMGTGSGLQAITAAKKQNVATVIACDVSAAALSCAAQNAEKNKCKKKIKFIQSNLFSNIPNAEKFNCIIFNPPYLPTETGEVKDERSATWDGGRGGRKILEPFLEQFSKFLAPDGKLLLVQSSLNGPKKTMKKLKELGLEVEIVERQKFFFEELYIYKGEKIEKNNRKNRGT